MSRETDSNNDFNHYNEQTKLIWDRKKLGIDLLHKFDLYFVTLIFTLLGLAIQTATKSPYLIQNYVEIFGWFLLFISGLISLSGISKLSTREIGIAEVKHLQLNSHQSKGLQQEVEGIEKKIKLSRGARNHLFTIGLFALMISRGTQLVS